MKTPLLFGLWVAIPLLARDAVADQKAACLDAASRGQKLRDNHKLVEAREQFRACAAAACPSIVQNDCAKWLVATEKSLPTVVITAKNGAGAPLVDVNVTADGQPFASRLEGQAVAIDPGSHTLHFQAPDGTTLDQQVVVTEGEQNQRVAVVLGPPVSAAAAAPASSAAGAGEHESAGGGPWKTVGWVLGAVGVVGLGVGTVFGVMAINDNNSAQCNANNQCLHGPLSDARSAATVADIGLIAGGVLLAGGAALVLFGPGAGKEHAVATAAIEPMVGPHGGGLAVGAAW